MINSGIILLLLLPLFLLSLRAGIIFPLQNPGVLFFAFLAIVLIFFISKFFGRRYFDKRKRENDATGGEVWLREERKNGNIRPPAAADDSQSKDFTVKKTSSLFSEPEKIFQSEIVHKRSDFSTIGAEDRIVILSVETPDELPEGSLSKEPAIAVDIKRNESAVLRFNRPRERNALSQEVLAAIEYIFDEVIPEHNPRVIIFTGTGEVFASGANLKEILSLDKNLARDFARRGQDLMNKIAAAKPLTVAAVNGYCFGGALDLALACDARIAGRNAVFCHPGVNLGIITGWGGTQRLPRLIGEARALEMFLTAKRVHAAEAAEIGLVDEIAENPLSFALANCKR